MTSIPYPSFQLFDQLVGRLRTTDYRRLALSIWGAIITACVYTYIAGQFTRRAVNFLLPHAITALKACVAFLETTLDPQPVPTLPTAPLPKPGNVSRAAKATRRSGK